MVEGYVYEKRYECLKKFQIREHQTHCGRRFRCFFAQAGRIGDRVEREETTEEH